MCTTYTDESATTTRKMHEKERKIGSTSPTASTQPLSPSLFCRYMFLFSHRGRRCYLPSHENLSSVDVNDISNVFLYHFLRSTSIFTSSLLTVISLILYAYARTQQKEKQFFVNYFVSFLHRVYLHICLCNITCRVFVSPKYCVFLSSLFLRFICSVTFKCQASFAYTFCVFFFTLTIFNHCQLKR